MNSPLQFKKYDAQYYRKLRVQRQNSKQKQRQTNYQTTANNKSLFNQKKNAVTKHQNNFFTKRTQSPTVINSQNETFKKTTPNKYKNTNLDNTQKIQPQNQRFCKTATNLKIQSKVHTKFQDLNEQELDAQRRIFLRHKRFSSVEQPEQVKQYKSNLKRKVKFNQRKLVQQLSPNHKKTTLPLKARSPSILKNKQKRKVQRLRSLPSNNLGKLQTHEREETSIDVKQNIIDKQEKMSLIIKNKYVSILQNLQHKYIKETSNKKISIKQKPLNKQNCIGQNFQYSDPYFPPTYTSLFSSFEQQNKRKQKNEQIKWMRIQQVFPEYQLTILKQHPANSKLKLKNQTNQTKLCAKHIATVLNAIQNSCQLLQNIFQLSKVVNKFGIYILKIYYQNTWKYKIIDDKIPVIQKNKKQQSCFNINSNFTPAFLNVQLQKNNQKEQLQIWPFLLEKAYASCYSSYQALQIGNSVDFLYQVAGAPPQQIVFNSSKIQAIQLIKTHFSQKMNCGLSQVDKTYPQSALISYNNTKPSLKQLSNQKEYSLVCIDPMNNYQQNILQYIKLPSLFNRIYLYKMQKFAYHVISILGRYLKAQKFERSQISLRMLKVSKNTQCTISICQKDQKLYANSSIKYQYIWNRVILVSKELNGGYRWIDGQYSNRKSINFRYFLNSGQYILIVMPQWRSIHCHQLDILVNSHQKITIQKAQIKKHDRIIQKSCLDLAQRFGNLHQINTFICSYNYLCKQAGLIIQNINNERMTGSIKVIRSINGLKAKVQLVPVNCQFYDLSKQQKRKNLKKYKNSIEVLIPKGQAFTVIIKMRGGIDQSFFSVFDFGN